MRGEARGPVGTLESSEVVDREPRAFKCTQRLDQRAGRKDSRVIGVLPSCKDHHQHIEMNCAVVGAGLVGCLASAMLAKQGWSVTLYELRPGTSGTSSLLRSPQHKVDS
jgi:NADPH-dependent 2,4-dienoyl-CoA reductase/sulfur reductase-like enzyme